MNVTVDDLMVSQVMTATPSQTVERARNVMKKHGVSALPVVNPEGVPLGIVTSTDLMVAKSDASPLSSLMTKKVFTVPRYAGPHLAARIMRNNSLHHVVVTHEQKVVGILSTYDLLRLVEDHRYSMKNSPTKAPKRGIKSMDGSVPETS